MQENFVQRTSITLQSLWCSLGKINGIDVIIVMGKKGGKEKKQASASILVPFLFTEFPHFGIISHIKEHF